MTSVPHGPQHTRHDELLTLPRAEFPFLLGLSLRNCSWRLTHNFDSSDVRLLWLGTNCPLRVVSYTGLELLFPGNLTGHSDHSLDVLSYTGFNLNLCELNWNGWYYALYGGDCVIPKGHHSL